MRPPEGYGLAYVDWAQQEFGIAAALSGDPLMLEAYRSGDPYLAFAEQAGAAPPDATKASLGPKRQLFKACVLGVQFGMSEFGLAVRLGNKPARGPRIVTGYTADTIKPFGNGPTSINLAMLTPVIHTAFGWTISYWRAQSNPRSLMNFPDAGERCGNATARLLPRHRARDPGLRTDP